MEQVSWWYIIGFAFLLFLWFDFIERMLGLDKKPDEMHHEKMRKEREKRAKNAQKRR